MRSPVSRIKTVINTELFKQLGAPMMQLMRALKKCLSRYSKKFSRVGGAVGINNGGQGLLTAQSEIFVIS